MDASADVWLVNKYPSGLSVTLGLKEELLASHKRSRVFVKILLSIIVFSY